ncbi:maleylpyruvate isomerase family mycothiol-dependent enzyme [Promicromonospora thailandica]|uniref:TIGR03083 family protein n=1 Tax=Promicromonospora thailandica TaxID=765201 RepID=A0A9X2G0Q7_9MICO|nr:maleylpyruvate isomerase family mycothiol-dependent enzyme [Promicromonospora thailandica]MCP2264922.1 TIGR03083 family protein [Promicromonospora thailandica]BFF18806.1 maleylpyruvate isomerase family mycothiol-dependent enzyme [Promicromonospora thailandica]
MEHLSAAQAREHAALVADLHTLTAEQWRSPSLCGEWTVEEVVAHLGAASLLGPVRWLRSMAEARFDPDVHNQRRLEEFLGATPRGTLDRFAEAGPIRLPFRESPGGLGELIVHAEDIRRPLGLVHAPDPGALAAVARFFATKDFAVNSRTVVKGLRLEASDAGFRTGRGPEVVGPLLSLVMVMAGRPAFLPDLDGDGMPELRRRLGQASAGT